jgi:hypothetical protein
MTAPHFDFVATGRATGPPHSPEGAFRSAVYAPQTSCPLGYTEDDLQRILGARLDEFHRWMRGQTTSVCDGRRYNHEVGEHELSDCSDAPHGTVVYAVDVLQFLRGGRPLD